MKIKFMNFLAVAFVAMATVVTFSACSSDDADDVAAPAEQASRIKFNIGVGNAMATRAKGFNGVNRAKAFNSQSDISNLSFSMFCETAAGKPYFIGASAMSPCDYLVRNLPFTYDGRGCPVWPDPKVKLNFYAFSPSPVVNGSFTKLSSFIKHKNDSTVEICTPYDANRQFDLMFASSLNQTKKTNNGVVNLNFKHLMTQINVEAKVYKDYDIKVNNIILYGGFNIFDMNPRTGKLSNPRASSVGDSMPYYLLASYGNKSLTNEYTRLNAEPIIVSPFFATAWNPAEGAIKKGTVCYLYLHYVLTDKKSGAVIVDGSDVYLPIDMNGNQGKNVTIRLNFTRNGQNGYDRDGNPTTSRIKYNVTINDWQETSPKSFKM